MDIKELATGGVVVVGGVIYGISQIGLGEALSEEIRPISEVSYEERPAYMDKIVGEFAETFSSYIIETENYTYVGYSNFSASPINATFVEVVNQDGTASEKEMNDVKVWMEASNFCTQDEMTMFTENGWSYHFSITDSNERQVFALSLIHI